MRAGNDQMNAHRFQPRVGMLKYSKTLRGTNIGRVSDGRRGDEARRRRVPSRYRVVAKQGWSSARYPECVRRLSHLLAQGVYGLVTKPLNDLT